MADDLLTRIVIRADDRTQPGLRSARRGLYSIRDALKAVQSHATTALSSLVLLGGGVEGTRRALAATVRAYAAVETGLVGVQKTANLTEAEVGRLDARLRSLSLDAGVGAARTELLEIAQAAGQLGVMGVDNLTKFAATIAKLQSATDLAGAEAATSLARILNNIRGEGVEDVDRLASTITRLGNEFAATESEITGAATRIAVATALYGTSSAEAAALGAALKSLGIEAEQGGTAVGRGFASIATALREGGAGAERLVDLLGEPLEQLRQRFRADAGGVFRDFISGLGDVHDAGGSVVDVLEALGLEGERVDQVYGSLATQADLLRAALDAAGDEWGRNTALTEEAQRASRTFSAQLALVGREIDAQAAAIAGS